MTQDIGPVLNSTDKKIPYIVKEVMMYGKETYILICLVYASWITLLYSYTIAIVGSDNQWHDIHYFSPQNECFGRLRFFSEPYKMF